MEKITLQTESYLFEGLKGQFRTIPFYELEYNEWVIFEDGSPKYFISFDFDNPSTDPLNAEIEAKLKSGEDLDTIIKNIGLEVNKDWTVDHNIQGKEIENSWKPETVTLILFSNQTYHKLKA